MPHTPTPDQYRYSIFHQGISNTFHRSVIRSIISALGIIIPLEEFVKGGRRRGAVSCVCPCLIRSFAILSLSYLVQARHDRSPYSSYIAAVHWKLSAAFSCRARRGCSCCWTLGPLRSPPVRLAPPLSPFLLFTNIQHQSEVPKACSTLWTFKIPKPQQEEIALVVIKAPNYHIFHHPNPLTQRSLHLSF
jgi:hypothetical protein